jgi:hypothetical protein
MKQNIIFYCSQSLPDRFIKKGLLSQTELYLHWHGQQKEKLILNSWLITDMVYVNASVAANKSNDMQKSRL